MALLDTERVLPEKKDQRADWRITGLVRGVKVAASEKVCFVKLRVSNDLRTGQHKTFDVFDVRCFRRNVDDDVWGLVCGLKRDWLVYVDGQLTMGKKYGVSKSFFVPRMSLLYCKVLSTRTREGGLARVRAALSGGDEEFEVVTELDDFDDDLFPFD